MDSIDFIDKDWGLWIPWISLIKIADYGFHRFHWQRLGIMDSMDFIDKDCGLWIPWISLIKIADYGFHRFH